MPLRDIVVAPIKNSYGSEVSVLLPDGSEHHQWIRSDHPLVPAADDLTPWLYALLPLAMSMEARLVLRGSVDHVGLEGSRQAGIKLAQWYPKSLRAVEVVAGAQHESVTAQGTAAFFSGGVDSFHTLAAARPSLDTIVFVGGFDIPWGDIERLDSAWGVAADAAREFGVRPIRVDANIRDLTDGHTHWGYEQHGASIAAVAYTLRQSVGQVRIASSYVDDQLHPWGTHPDLDSLWSSSAQTLSHDQTNETRAEKVAALATSHSFRRGVRVCWRSQESGNCGTCEKCVRTRVNLRATGNDGICDTLAPLDLADLARLPLSDPGERLFAEESLAYIRSAGVQDDELEQALSKSIDRGIRRERVAKLVRATVFKIPGARAAIDRARGR